jgi:diaminopimelate epimerase
LITLASASGNVFAFLWARDVPAAFDGPAWARVLCPRGEGLGLDGLFLLQPFRPGTPWTLAHWDPDGTPSFCSNGTRAAAALLPEGTRGDLDAVVSGEAVQLRLQASQVGLRMPEGPGYGLLPDALPLDLPHAYGWTGTPQLVIEVPDVQAIDLAVFAPPLRHHATLPDGANVSILQVLEPGRARIRTWERGVEGETLCCGQGCAFAASWLAGRTGIPAWHLQPSGRDPVRVEGSFRPDGTWRELWLSGPVRHLGGLRPGRDLQLPGPVS